MHIPLASKPNSWGHDVEPDDMNGPLALTLGEPAGIGPDITIASWTRRAELELPAFYVLGDAAYLHERAARLGISRSAVYYKARKHNIEISKLRN